MENRLVNLARSKFGELTKCEEILVGSSTSGDFAYCGPNEDEHDPANDPMQSGKWVKDRVIRAQLLVWLCTERSVRSAYALPLGVWFGLAGLLVSGPALSLEIGRRNVRDAHPFFEFAA